MSIEVLKFSDWPLDGLKLDFVSAHSFSAGEGGKLRRFERDTRSIPYGRFILYVRRRRRFARCHELNIIRIVHVSNRHLMVTLIYV